ncbi:hypothetical protein [Achromobacter marplatensis]|uniref:hypothetical protein n=1 Tax=Achromobacter marplatensis TaxID=470868 RepID=UPI0039F6711D
MISPPKSNSHPSLPITAHQEGASSGLIGPHQVQVSDSNKAIVPWRGTPESTGASPSWVESPPTVPLLPGKPLAAPHLPAAKEKKPALVQDLKSVPNYLRDEILRLAASDLRTNVAWRGRLSKARDAQGRHQAEGIATLHQSTRPVFRGAIHTLHDLKLGTKWAGMEIGYLRITFDLDSDDMEHIPPRIHTLELQPGFGADSRPRFSVPAGIGTKDICALRLTNMMVFNCDITDIAHIENLDHLTVAHGWIFLDGLTDALKAATRLHDFRLVDAALRGSDPGFRPGASTSYSCLNLMRGLAGIPHLLSLTLAGVGGIIPASPSEAQEAQTESPSAPSSRLRRLTLTDVTPLLTGCQKRLDLSNNQIAFDRDTIPELGPNLEWLNLKGNGILPDTIQQMRNRYPDKRIEADDTV